MARSQQNPSGTEFIAIPRGTVEEGELLGEELTDEESAFNEFRTGFGAEKMGELRVGKLKLGKDGSPTATSKSAHCFSCPIDRYSYSELLEFIREHYGSGVFRVVGIESGRKGVVFNKLIEIAEERGPRPGPQESPLQNPQNMLESVGRIMAESSARTEALISRLTENRLAPAPAPDPMEMMSKMAGLMATLMGVVPKPSGGGDDLLSQLEKLAKVKELLGGFGGDSGGGDKESNFYDVVKTGLQSFGPALASLALKAQSAGQNPALAPPAQQFQPAPTPPFPQTPPQSAPQQPAGDTAVNFKRQVDILVMNAKSGVDPMQLAGSVLDLTPDDKIDDLATMLESPDVIDKMASYNPEVNAHRPFFDKLRTSILSLIDDGDPDTLAPNSQPAAGETGAPKT